MSERFEPDGLEISMFEHFHRYAAVTTHVAGRRVLDAACGEGYGSALLARRAAAVVGLDVSSEAIQRAAAKYGSANLRYQTGDCEQLPLSSAAFDVYVCLETIEHVSSPERLLAEARRVLKPGGTLFVSTPNRPAYSEVKGYQNPFHVKEFTRDEFLALLGDYFRPVRLFGQRVFTLSTVWPLKGSGSRLAWLHTDVRADEVTEGSADAEPLYFIAACERPSLLSFMLPRVNRMNVDSVFSVGRPAVDVEIDHARGVVSQKEAEIAQARMTIEGLVAEVDQARDTINGLVGRLDTAREHIEHLKALLARAEADNARLTARWQLNRRVIQRVCRRKGTVEADPGEPPDVAPGGGKPQT